MPTHAEEGDKMAAPAPSRCGLCACQVYREEVEANGIVCPNPLCGHNQYEHIREPPAAAPAAPGKIASLSSVAAARLACPGACALVWVRACASLVLLFVRTCVLALRVLVTLILLVLVLVLVIVLVLRAR